MDLEDKQVSIICQDFCESVIVAGMTEYEPFFPVTSYLGKLIKLCETLRSDINEEKEVSIDIFMNLMSTCGLYNLQEYVIQELVSIHIIDNKGKTIILRFERQSDLLSVLGRYWKERLENSPNTKDFELGIVQILSILEKRFITGEEKEQLLAQIPDISRRKILIILLQKIGLVSYSEKYDIYYSPNTFGKNIKDAEEKICSVLNSSKIKDYESIIDSVKENPGLPYSHVSQNKDALNNLIQMGILDPVEVEIGGTRIPFLWSPSQSKTDDLLWAQKTASHFKFGQCFANPSKGRLRDPTVFINKLIDQGYAGNASNIGTDYNPLLLNRIIRVQKTGLSEKYVMYPIKKDILKQSLSLLELGKVISPKQLTLDYYFEKLKNPNQARLNPELTMLKEKEDQANIKKILEMLKNG